jgi:hypothetical protein
MSVQCARNLFAVRDSTYCPCRAEVVVIAPWLDISREGHVHIRIAPFKRIQSDRKGEAFDVQTRIPRFPVLLAFTPTKQRRKPKRTAIDFVLEFQSLVFLNSLNGFQRLTENFGNGFPVSGLCVANRRKSRSRSITSYPTTI